MNVNVNGALLCTRACVPSMKTRGAGAIVNQSSTAAWMAAGFYGLAKLALNGLTQGLARELGFRGGLVPGVTVYAWMTHPVVAALGEPWLERGTFRARFLSPIYFDEPVVIEAAVASLTGQSVAIETRAVNSAGELCATATFGLTEGASPAAPDLGNYPAAALPDERPRVSREVLAARTVLGTPELVLDAATARAFLDRVGEPLALYGGLAAPAHPGLYLQEANRALSRNVIVSPWIHAESEGQHLGALRVGTPSSIHPSRCKRHPFVSAHSPTSSRRPSSSSSTTSARRRRRCAPSSPPVAISRPRLSRS